VGTGEDLRALANSIIDSYEMRVRTVNGLMDQAYSFLKSFQMELEDMIARLRDNLAKAESLRKKDFDRMIGDVIERRHESEEEGQDRDSRSSRRKRRRWSGGSGRSFSAGAAQPWEIWRPLRKISHDVRKSARRE